MTLTNALVIIVIAGLCNGSFVIPAQRIKDLSQEKIWYCHSLIGLLILPWLMLLIFSPSSFANYQYLSMSHFILLLFAGGIFGVGQVFFASAIKKIGIRLSFAINLSIGSALGSFFVVVLKTQLFSHNGLLVALATCLVLASLALYYFCGRLHKVEQSQGDYGTGWLAAVIAGLASGMQNAVFVYLAFHVSHAVQFSNAFWIWPPFLLAASIIMLYGFSRKKRGNVRHHTGDTNLKVTVINWILILMMGLLFTGSLVLYSVGMTNLPNNHVIIGWPAFMAAIILTTQCWGLFLHESHVDSIRGKVLSLLSLSSLLLAIVLLAQVN